ncbi:MAG: hypothetical protein K2M55_03180 [Muribaculaceae bacterium]|nr:hypothetical protein [Muribaculaceae bacterium]
MKVRSVIENLGVIAIGGLILLTLFIWALYPAFTDTPYDKEEKIDEYTYAESDHSKMLWGEAENSDGGTPKKRFSLHDITAYRSTDDYILIRKKNGRLKEESGILKSDEDTDAEMFEYTHGSNVYYFILEKATCRVYGPYIYDELVDKCNELNIRIF